MNEELRSLALLLMEGDVPSEKRYRVTLEVSRRVSVPAYGPEASTIKTLRGDWSYGKDGDYASSKYAVDVLSKLIKPYLHLCSSCSIIVWNGCNGSSNTIKHSEERFLTDFDGKTIEV